MNEPVAWMDDFGNVFEIKNKLFYIPLYTHTAKTLTDEDAEQAFKEWEKTETFPVSNIEAHGFINGFRWAIAILRKAQE